MISILIPVFNATVQLLVQELSDQLRFLKIEGEVLVYDDLSGDFFKERNRHISSLEKVVYKELDKNYGRAAIRSLLARDACYDWLIFIDSDSTITNKNFLQNYLYEITNGYEVYVGGRVYPANAPADCNKRLHWKYGVERESIKGNTNVLHTNNFCIRKDIFLQLNFPDQLTGYGHEDTWMEIVLNSEGKKISFIDNPVLHEGLEGAAVFLGKTENALKNLLSLSQIVNERLLRKKVGLYNLFFWQRKLGLDKIIAPVLEKRLERIVNNLQSCQPSLTQFDLYRLYHLIKISKGQPGKLFHKN
jgi:glycosyltransferase involved in cell wall biosynthesis